MAQVAGKLFSFGARLLSVCLFFVFDLFIFGRHHLFDYLFLINLIIIFASLFYALQ